MARGLRKLSDWQIAEILLSRTSDALTARLYGVSKTAISNIRNGKSFKQIRPDIERRKPIRQRVKPDPVTLEVSCLKCAHWYKGKCTFDFPDPVREGLQVAEECSMYEV